MKRIFLVGYMGAGKTTLGKLIAKQLNFSFIDLDCYIEKRYLKTINQLFNEKGESGFREIEKNMLHEIGDFDDVIIATGGGAPCFFDNLAYMNRQGITVYLDTSIDTLTVRLSAAKNSRPLLKDKSNEELKQFVTEVLEKRKMFYEQAAILFDTDKLDTKEEIDMCASQLCSVIEMYAQQRMEAQ